MFDPFRVLIGCWYFGPMMTFLWFSSEDELDVLLNGTLEQKKKLIREYLTGESESSSGDDFEKEMEAELSSTLRTMEGTWGSPATGKLHFFFSNTWWLFWLDPSMMFIGLFFRRNWWWQQVTSQHPHVRWGVLWLRLGGRGQARLAWTFLSMSSHVVCVVSMKTKTCVVCRELHRPQAETADDKKQRRAAVWPWRGWQGPGLGGRQEEAVSSSTSLPHPTGSVLFLWPHRCSCPLQV